LTSEEDHYTLCNLVNSVTREPQQRQLAKVSENRAYSVATSQTSFMVVQTELSSLPLNDQTGLTGGAKHSSRVLDLGIILLYASPPAPLLTPPLPTTLPR
jgi:hypothetical protein